MKDPVLIKSNRYGMTLRFDPELPFDLLRERVHGCCHAVVEVVLSSNCYVTYYFVRRIAKVKTKTRCA